MAVPRDPDGTADSGELALPEMTDRLFYLH